MTNDEARYVTLPSRHDGWLVWDRRRLEEVTTWSTELDALGEAARLNAEEHDLDVIAALSSPGEDAAYEVQVPSHDVEAREYAAEVHTTRELATLRAKVVGAWQAYEYFRDCGDPDGDPSYYSDLAEFRAKLDAARAELEARFPRASL